jgi:hypothetical protein
MVQGINYPNGSEEAISRAHTELRIVPFSPAKLESPIIYRALST